MSKVSTTMALMAVGATAAVVAYSTLNQKTKNQLKRDANNALDDVNAIREGMMDAAEDVTKMAKNLTNNM